MSNMKPTPGPWFFGVYEATPKFRAVEQHACVCREDMSLVAVTGPAGDRQSEVDAELMAAAPDLLEVAEAILRTAEPCPTCFGTGTNRLGDACGHCGGIGETCRATGELGALRAAVAKARGEQ